MGEMKIENIQLLKQEVERRLGRSILSSADCHELSSEIEIKTKARISFNTIRRLFDLIKADHQPSMYTLNSLSCFCGYSSFDDFLKSKPSQELNPENGEGLLNFMILLFKSAEVINQDDTTFLSLTKHTIDYIVQRPYLIERFQKEIAGTKNGQNFYYERFIHYDKLNSFYGEGLYLYLENKKDSEAHIFTYSLLCFKSWLTMNDGDVDKYHFIINKYNIHELTKPSICARYYASQVFYLNVAGLNTEQVIFKSRQYYSTNKLESSPYTCFECFEIVMAEALILTKQYNEALFYINELSEKIESFIFNETYTSILETILLFKAIIYALNRKKQLSIEMFDAISPTRFCFLSKQYQTLLYLLLKGLLRNNSTDHEQVLYLVKQTGFERLLFLWENDYCMLYKNPKAEINYNLSKNGQKNDCASY